MGLKVIITGSTGMVGEGIMRVCMDRPEVDEILVINRKHNGVNHPKVKELILSDFMQMESVADQLKGYDACFHCMGVTSVGADMQVYKVITQDVSLLLGEICCRENPGSTFIYLSGAGTDETESSKMEWARIKGHTENELAKMAFKNYHSYRPGFIKPYPGQMFSHPYYKYMNWMFPFGKLIAADVFNTMEELGRSMIQLSLQPTNQRIIKGRQITELAGKL